MIAASAAVVGLRFEVTTEITHFLPAGDDLELAELSRRLADSELTRTIILSVGAADAEQAVAAAKTLAAGIAEHPEVAWLRSGVAEDEQRAFYDTWFPRRFHFAPATLALDDAGLEAAAGELKKQLSLPTAALIKRVAGKDPLLLFPQLTERLQAARAGSLELVDGHFVSSEGHAIIFLGSHAPAFDAKRLAGLLDAIDAGAAQLGDGVTVEQSAVARFARASERAIRADITRISTLSTICVVLLFLLIFRSLRFILVGVLPLVAGVLCATAALLLIFERVHGLTMAFGSTLIGICIDYPIHYFNHHTLEPDPAGPRGSLRRVWVGLLMGALTTVAGFGGLSFGSFPGIQEIGIFASVGILAALFTTRAVLPAFLPTQGREVGLQRRLASSLGALVAAMGQRRRALVLLPATALLLCGLGLPQLNWVDDVRVLNRLEPEMLAEDERVRARVSRVESARFVVSRGATLEAALRANDEVFTKLEGLTAGGQVESFRSLHTLLPSKAQQQRSAQRFADPELAPRLERVFTEAGYNAAAFAGFRDDLERLKKGELQPLSWADLEGTPVLDIARPFRVTLGDTQGVLTFLKGVSDPGALRAAVADLEGVAYFDQTEFMADTYGRYRRRTLELVALGLIAVFLLVLGRYRHPGLAAAAFLPAFLAAATTLALLGLLGIETHLMHVIALLLVLSMGVDYGIFLAESRREGDAGALAATVLSLCVACLTTVFAFGLLAMSIVPALAAIGTTTGIGVLLSLLLAPTTLVLTTGAQR